MRFLANLIVALTLVWPVPLAMPAAFAATGHPGTSHATSHAMSGDAAHHADHAAQPPAPIQHDIEHMADCCIGTACFGFGLADAAGVSFQPPRAQPPAGKPVHLMAVAHPPDLPPPRL